MYHIVYVRSGSIYNDSRATKQIKAFIEAGYKLSIIAWDRMGTARERCETVFEDAYSSIDFYFFSLSIENEGGMKNSTKFISWIKYVNNTLKKIKSIDAVHACNLDAGYGAYLYCKKRHVKLIYDIYDYYIDSHAIPKVLRGFVEKSEIKVINFAVGTIICTEERKEQIKKASPKKVIVIHNSPEMKDKPISQELIYDYSYCGSLTDRRLVKEIVENYNNHTQYSFCFAGNGKYTDLVAAAARQHNNFQYKDSIPYSEVLQIESQTKVLSAIYEPTIRNHRLCAPNKFYESLALGKPIIVCRGTGIDKVVESNNIGIVIDYDVQQFYDALRYLCENNEVCYDMGIRARELYEKQYNWEIMKKRLLDMYELML